MTFLTEDAVMVDQGEFFRAPGAGPHLPERGTEFELTTERLGDLRVDDEHRVLTVRLERASPAASPTWTTGSRCGTTSSPNP